MTKLLKNRFLASAAVLAAFSVSIPAVAQQSDAAFLYAKRFDLAGRVTGTIAPDPDGSGELGYPAVRNVYDSKGRLIRIESGELQSWEDETVPPDTWASFLVHSTKTYSYDGYGRKQKESVLGESGETVAVTQYNYHSAERVKCKAVRMNPSAFSALPSDACRLGPEGQFGPDRITHYTYDIRDQVLTEVRAFSTPLQQTYTTNTYDGRRLTSQTDANGNKTELRYDSYRRLRQRVYPSKTIAGQLNESDYNEYKYDANGNLNWERKRDGSIFTYGHDANNRMTKKDGPGTSMDVVYDYDLRGLTLYSRFGSATGPGITNKFDGFGNLEHSTNNMGGVSRKLSYLYDKNGNRERVTHPDNVYFAYQFDGLDRVKSVSENTSSLLAVNYQQNGRRKEIARTGSAKTAYEFNNAQRLDRFIQTFSSTQHNLTNSFKYNPASQVTELTIGNAAYYPRGNNNQTGSYTPNGLNQYTQINGQTVHYDAKGNLTSYGGITYSYDAENRLTGTTGGVTSTIKYDPLGRLFEITTGTTKTQFLYDGDALVAEYNGNTGALTRRYVHGDQVDEPWVQYNSASLGASHRRYLHADHQGSIIAHSGGNGAVLNTLAYDSFGIPDSKNIDRFGYTGQIWLKDLGLFHYKARMYSPKLGRFLQTDPIFYEDQMNMYAYVANDPVNLRDPTGEFAMIIGFAAGVGLEVARQAVTGELRNGGVAANLGKALIAGASGATGAGLGRGVAALSTSIAVRAAANAAGGAAIGAAGTIGNNAIAGKGLTDGIGKGAAMGAAGAAAGSIAGDVVDGAISAVRTSATDGLSLSTKNLMQHIDETTSSALGSTKGAAVGAGEASSNFISNSMGAADAAVSCSGENKQC